MDLAGLYLASIYPWAFVSTSVPDANPLRFEELPLLTAVTSSERSVGSYDAPPRQPITTPLQQVANSSSRTRVTCFLCNLPVGSNFAGLKPL
jgi:hypothetical protein